MKHIVLLGLVVGVGCGKIDQVTVDAHVQSDAVIDAVDANLGGTLSVVTQNHVPGSGAIGSAAAATAVFSLSPTGTMLDMQMTDASGSASVMAYPGGSVTAVYPHRNDNGGGSAMQGADLVTYVGVDTGDTLTFGARFIPPAGTQTGTVTVSFPNEGEEVEETYVTTPCGNYFEFEFPVTVPVYAWCEAAPWEVSVAQLSFGGPQEFYYSVGSGTLNGAAAPNDNATVSGTFGASHAIAASIAGLPAEVTSASFNLNGEINLSTFGFNVGSGFGVSATLGSGATAGTGSGTITAYVNGDSYQATATLFRGGNFGTTTVYQPLPTSAATLTMGTIAPPPWINSHVYFSEEAKVEWAIDSTTGASTFDATVVNVTWSHSVTVSGTTTSVPYAWTFIVPPGVTSLTLPTLPAALASFAPQPAVDNVTASVTLVEFPSINGYAALRAVPERDIVCPDCAVRAGDMTSAMVNQ